MRPTLQRALGRVNPKAVIRICWPEPDKVCLQSGCTWCQDSTHRIQISTVAKYAEERGMGEDFAYGLGADWATRHKVWASRS